MPVGKELDDLSVDIWIDHDLSAGGGLFGVSTTPNARIVSPSQPANEQATTPFFVFWQVKLGILDYALHTLNQIQRKWVYLEPIFGMGALPAEQGRFRRVEEEFRDIMAKVGNSVEAARRFFVIDPSSVVIFALLSPFGLLSASFLSAAYSRS